MIGGDVIREVLKDEQVGSVISIGRSKTGLAHSKLREILHDDVFNLDALSHELQGIDACFGALGANPTTNMAQFERITKLYTLQYARALASASPEATFVLVSGSLSDSKNQLSWALRIKGETENELLSLPLSSYVLRPLVVRSSYGSKSKTTLYRIMQTLGAPILPVLMKILPNQFTTTENLGQVFLELIKHGHSNRILENSDINQLAETIKTATPRKL